MELIKFESEILVVVLIMVEALNYKTYFCIAKLDNKFFMIFYIQIIFNYNDLNSSINYMV